MIDSPALAESIANAFVGSIPARAYELRLSAAGSLRWVEQSDGGEIVHDREPGASFWRRFGVSVMSLLPIERQL